MNALISSVRLALVMSLCRRSYVSAAQITFCALTIGAIGIEARADSAITRHLLETLPKYEGKASPNAAETEAPPPFLRKEAADKWSEKKLRRRPRPPEVPAVRLDPVVVSVTPLGETENPLPRPPIPRVEADVKIDGFFTEKARDEALLKRHLSVFDREVLNRMTLPLFGSRDRKSVV